jgi:hypothetical protein
MMDYQPMNRTGEQEAYAAACEDIRRAQGWLRLQLAHELAKRIDGGEFDGVVRPVKE